MWGLGWWEGGLVRGQRGARLEVRVGRSGGLAFVRRICVVVFSFGAWVFVVAWVV